MGSHYHWANIIKENLFQGQDSMNVLPCGLLECTGEQRACFTHHGSQEPKNGGAFNVERMQWYLMSDFIEGV